MNLRPQGPHQWRQADCLSFTLNYAEDDLPFFEPQLHKLTADNRTTGKTSGEFPALYYAVGNLWKVTGQSENLYRIINLVFFILGLWSLFATLKNFVEHKSLAIAVAVLPITIPVLTYFAPNFLQNTTALSSALIAWFLSFKFYRSKKTVWALLAILFFTLAGLLKITGLISFIALMGTLFFDAVGSRKISRQIGSPLRFWSLYIFAGFVVMGSSIAWYEYSKWYCTTHDMWFTFNDLWPIWQSDWAYLKETFTVVKTLWIKQYLTPVHYLLLFASVAFFATHFRRLSFFEKSMTILLTIGSIAYLMLWFKAIYEHDYYLINLYILPILLWSIGAIHFSRHTPIKSNSKFLSAFLGVTIMLSALNAHKKIEYRYESWLNDFGTNRFTPLFDITPHLRNNLQIDRKTPVIIYPDASYSISLYLSDQVGWPLPKSAHIDDFKLHIEQDGAEYILVLDKEQFASIASIEKLPIEKVSEYEGVLIYRVTTAE